MNKFFNNFKKNYFGAILESNYFLSKNVFKHNFMWVSDEKIMIQFQKNV